MRGLLVPLGPPAAHSPWEGEGVVKPGHLLGCRHLEPSLSSLATRAGFIWACDPYRAPRLGPMLGLMFCYRCLKLLIFEPAPRIFILLWALLIMWLVLPVTHLSWSGNLLSVSL